MCPLKEKHVPWYQHGFRLCKIDTVNNFHDVLFLSQDNVCQDDPDNSLWGNLVCLAFGLILTQGAQATQFILKSRLDPEKTTFIAAARIYAVVWGFADIYLWKSIWDGINCLFGKNELTGTATMLIGMFGLQVGGALRSAASVPVGIVLDDEENMCTAHLYLKSTVRSSLQDTQI